MWHNLRPNPEKEPGQHSWCLQVSFGKMLQGQSLCESTVALFIHAYGCATGLLLLPRMTGNMRIPCPDCCHHPVILLWDHRKQRSSVQAETPMLAPQQSLSKAPSWVGCVPPHFLLQHLRPSEE